MVSLQDLATTAVALIGATIIVRRLTSAMRPKTAGKCEHCPTGAAVSAKHQPKPTKR